MNTVAIIQARTLSTRLPGKVFKEVNGISLLEILITRLSQCKRIDRIVLATTEDHSDDLLESAAKTLGISCFRGSTKDVLGRYAATARMTAAEVVVRITADCPLIDPELVDQAVERFLETGADYLSNSNPPTFPDGLDIEVFTSDALLQADSQAQTSFEREHVTPYIRNHAIRNELISAPKDYSRFRITVDEEADYFVVKRILEIADFNLLLNWKEIIKILEDHPQVCEINELLVRNEGATLSQGQKLWKRAKQIIPGGNMLLSKRPEMFLPDIWPSYFSSASGCTVVDLDGESYIDMSIMGIGTNSLGYGHPIVDSAVREVIAKGNMSTLNCPEEVWLAEQMIKLNPWATKVKFARTGGEANAIAIRIARAASGKDNVAICGYHGWHDWYLSANLSNNSELDGHLLPGLEPNGVPRNLQGTVHPFRYNDIAQLESLITEKRIGIIKMEVARNFGPQDGFLQKVRELASKNGIVLIFDECTSGFRETFGGLHKKYGVEPDMAMFGKALGNGYAITAVVGKESVMEAAQSSFISSTFWTERIGPAAALATLKVMEETESWKTITNLGEYVRSGWKSLANTYGLQIAHWGIPALAGFTVSGEDSQVYKTYITQEMLKKGYLAGNSFYASTAHTTQIIDTYLENLEPIFKTISKYQVGKLISSELLDGPVSHSGFQRLN